MKNILVIDDDLAILEVMKIILEDEGHKVTIQTNGDNILEKVLAVKPDMILLDYWIPGSKDGGQIAKEIKSHDASKDIPIVIISANHNIESQIAQLGVEHFLPKPFNIEELTALINRYNS